MLYDEKNKRDKSYLDWVYLSRSTYLSWQVQRQE